MRVSGNGIVETRVVVRNPGQYNQLCCRAPIGWEWDIVVTVSIWATGLNSSPYRDLVSWVLRDQKGAFCLLQFWVSHSLSLPPTPPLRGWRRFYLLLFHFHCYSIHCATVSHLHWSNFTVDWYQYRHDEFLKRKRKKKKNIYVSPCVTLSCSIWLYWMTGLKLYSIYICTKNSWCLFFFVIFIFHIPNFLQKN